MTVLISPTYLMKHSIIFWNSRPSQSTKDLVPKEIESAIDVIPANDSDDVRRLLCDHASIKTVVVCLHPADIETLYHIQALQKKHSTCAMLAIFTSNYHVSATTGSLRMLANSLRDRADPGTNIITGSMEADSEREGEPLHLTPRQVEVLALLMRGNSNKQIARILNISEGTIKIHCMSIFKELGVANRTQAAVFAEKVMPQFEVLWNKLPEERQRRILS